MFRGVAPGRYKVFSWETLPDRAELPAEFVQPYEQFGRAVSVNAGATLEGVSVPLIRAGR